MRLKSRSIICSRCRRKAWITRRFEVAVGPVLTAVHLHFCEEHDDEFVAQTRDGNMTVHEVRPMRCSVVWKRGKCFPNLRLLTYRNGISAEWRDARDGRSS